VDLRGLAPRAGGRVSKMTSLTIINRAGRNIYLIDHEEVSLNEWEHAQRAQKLEVAFGTAEFLAEFLHQNYRATAKSFKVPGPRHHDHGWGDCYGSAKRYFLRRARWLLTTRVSQNGRFGS